MSQVASAITWIHAHGVAHGDIKAVGRKLFLSNLTDHIGRKTYLLMRRGRLALQTLGSHHSLITNIITIVEPVKVRLEDKLY